jgi:hypothetical protein
MNEHATRGLRISAGEGRARVASAVALIQDELDRLHGLQAAAAKREGGEKELRRELARLNADADRRARADAFVDAKTIRVDRAWLVSLVSTLCDTLQSERRAAMQRHEQRRADAIAYQIDQVIGDHNRALERGRQ